MREENGRFYCVNGTEPTTHIIKPGIGELRDQALNGHISMVALRLAGVSVAETEFREFEGQPALIVKRYDRGTPSEGRLVRIHQGDVCQALSVLPRDKYE